MSKTRAVPEPDYGRLFQAGRDRKRAEGGRAEGRPPYGYRSEGGALVPDEHEQRGLALMLQLHAEGDSLRVIGQKLEAAGFKPKLAARWSAGSVSAILRRNLAGEGDNGG